MNSRSYAITPLSIASKQWLVDYFNRNHIEFMFYANGHINYEWYVASLTKMQYLELKARKEYKIKKKPIFRKLTIKKDYEFFV